MGDFNFPEIDWDTTTALPGNTNEALSSADSLLRFISNNLMNQYVHVPTRGNNILDLFISSNPYLVTHVTNKNTNLSDHDIIDINISSNPTAGYTSKKTDAFKLIP